MSQQISNERDIETSQRQAGLDFANRLSLLAGSAPDTATEKAVHSLADEVRKRYTYSKELRKREIIFHIQRATDTGGLSHRELIERTRYRKDDVYALVDLLAEEGRIEFRSVTPGGAGRGRPAVRLFTTRR